MDSKRVLSRQEKKFKQDKYPKLDHTYMLEY